MQNNELQPFFDLIPAALRSVCVIAGGAAVDLARADDVDIWLLNVPADSDKEAAVREHLRKRLQEVEVDLNLVGTDPWGLDFNPPMSFTEDTENDYDAGRVLFNVENYHGKKVQILGTSFVTVMGLLEHFDLSVHQKAILPDGTAIVAATHTLTSRPIDITNYHTPTRTFGRLRKLVKRYGPDTALGLVYLSVLLHATEGA